ncbi:MAG: hypothetical protein Kow00121_08100 [Elainellaceae cyanobacterium]
MVSSPSLGLHELHYNLGYVLHQQHDLVGAAQSYQQAIALQPSYINAHLNLAVVLDEQGQRSAAIRHYRQVIALQPNHLKAHNNLGCALTKQGQLEEAIQVYQQAIALQPNWAVLHHNLGQTLHNQDKLAEAMAAYRQAIRLQPDLAVAHHSLGKAFQQQGQHAQAIACFEQAARLNPKEASLVASDCGDSWLAQGQIQPALRWLQQAIVPQQQLIAAFCEWTAQLEPTQLEPTQLKPTVDEMTQARIACGRFLRALLNKQIEPIKHYDDLAQTWWHLANALMTYGGAGQQQQAQAYYAWVLHLQPNYREAYQQLNTCLLKQGKVNAATLLKPLALAICPEERCSDQPLFLQPQHLQSQPGRKDLLRSVQPRAATKVAESVQRTTAPSYPLPQGIYPSTQDWIAAHPAQGHYRPLSPFSEVADSKEARVPKQATPTPTPPTSCGGLNCQPCLQRLSKQFEPIHLGRGIYNCTFLGQDQVKAPPLFVATISNGRAWATPQQNDWLICNAIAVLSPNNDLLADLSRDYPGQLPGCQAHDPTCHRLFNQAHLPQPELIAGTVAVLTGLSGHNYYHWMVDVLPRFELLRRCGFDWTQIDWFWINQIKHPFQQATLECLGIPLERILVSDRHPHLQAERLVVPSFPGYLGWLEPWALQFLRSQFLPLAQAVTPPQGKFLERIYISRQQANHRRVLNEAALLEQLRPLGFVPIYLESMSLAEQITLFAHARVIVAPHGGGLTNTLFCQPETTVVELVNPHYIRHYYWVVSQQLGLRHYLATGDAVTCYPLRQLMYPSPLMEDIWVDLEALLPWLRSLL